MNINDPKFDEPKAFIVPNFFAFSMMGITAYFIPEPFIIGAEFILIPLVMGIISAWYLKHITQGTRFWARDAVILTFNAILLSLIFLGEGIICLIIVSPLIFAFISLGSAL